MLWMTWRQFRTQAIVAAAGLAAFAVLLAVTGVKLARLYNTSGLAGCHAHGDVLKFVMEMEGISFYEALKSLAERFGISMPKRSQYADDDSRKRGALLQMHELAQEQFRANLHSSAGEMARAYLVKRGVSAGLIPGQRASNKR